VDTSTGTLGRLGEIGNAGCNVRLAKQASNGSGRLVSNFPLFYRLSWLPRLLKPSQAGDDGSFGSSSARWHEPKTAVRVVFLGDLSAVANGEPPEIDAVLRETIAAADVVVANCESPVVGRPAFPVATKLGARHAMTPAFLDGVIAAMGIQPNRLVLSLANNHALDQGMAGLEETSTVLAARGVRTTGLVTGGPLQRVEVGAVTIGFLAFTEWRNADAAEFAGRVTMADDIAGWSERVDTADLVCALPHWDREFRHFPGGATRALAHRLATEGAGLVVGGHAHVVQPVERVGGSLVAYGLGDFLGTALRRAPWPLRIGAMLLVEVSADPATKGKVAAYGVVPFLREKRGRHERLSRVETADGGVAEKARQRLVSIFADSGGKGRGTRHRLRED
jgi:poly-gamma-glutamate capsule biosynthesis protein CapA/YwtB (metallophosphatase superfamily)